MEKSKRIYASECKCVDCGQQAVAFWPACDPDIPSHPYCRSCLDRNKRQMINELLMADCKSETAKLQKKESAIGAKRNKNQSNINSDCK